MPAARSQKRKRKGAALPSLDTLAGALEEAAPGAAAGAARGGGGGGGKAKHIASKGRGSSVKRLKARQAIA
jgi:hypothetical protein